MTTYYNDMAIYGIFLPWLNNDMTCTWQIGSRNIFLSVRGIEACSAPQLRLLELWLDDFFGANHRPPPFESSCCYVKWWEQEECCYVNGLLSFHLLSSSQKCLALHQQSRSSAWFSLLDFFNSVDSQAGSTWNLHPWSDRPSDDGMING